MPGRLRSVGEILALTWALEIGDYTRFSSNRQAISYCGLCADEKSSADKVMRMPAPPAAAKDEKLQRAPEEKLQKREEEKIFKAPLPEDQVLAHAELAKVVQTAICLDESITSAQAAEDAIQLGACQIINIKPGRVGGYLEARRIHDICAKHGVPVWMGGMLETGTAETIVRSLPSSAL